MISFKQFLLEGGAAGHMAHPFDLANVNSGRDLINIFNKLANSLAKKPSVVKIDGVNTSIDLLQMQKVRSNLQWIEVQIKKKMLKV